MKHFKWLLLLAVLVFVPKKLGDHINENRGVMKRQRYHYVAYLENDKTYSFWHNSDRVVLNQKGMVVCASNIIYRNVNRLEKIGSKTVRVSSSFKKRREKDTMILSYVLGVIVIPLFFFLLGRIVRLLTFKYYVTWHIPGERFGRTVKCYVYFISFLYRYESDGNKWFAINKLTGKKYRITFNSHKYTCDVMLRKRGGVLWTGSELINKLN